MVPERGPVRDAPAWRPDLKAVVTLHTPAFCAVGPHRQRVARGPARAAPVDTWGMTKMSDTVDETRDAALDRAARSETEDLGGTAAAGGDLTGFLRAYYRHVATEDLASFGPGRLAAVAAQHATLAAQ